MTGEEKRAGNPHRWRELMNEKDKGTETMEGEVWHGSYSLVRKLTNWREVPKEDVII